MCCLQNESTLWELIAAAKLTCVLVPSRLVRVNISIVLVAINTLNLKELSWPVPVNISVVLVAINTLYMKELSWPVLELKKRVELLKHRFNIFFKWLHSLRKSFRHKLEWSQSFRKHWQRQICHKICFVLIMNATTCPCYSICKYCHMMPLIED